MTPTIKDPPETTSPSKPDTHVQNSESKTGESPRSNPVCLEVGVTIRSLPNEAGALAKPIREEVRTVIVFDNGAVLRCAEILPVGHTVILSNPSGRDVVCRVVGGRNLLSVKGYVEVQFMESVSDFWNIHKTLDPVAATTPATVPPAQREAPVSPSTPAPSRPAAPLEAPPMPASVPLGSAPTFDDIGGLASVPLSAAARESKSEPGRSGMEMTAKSISSYNQSGMGKSTSLANWELQNSGSPSENHATSSSTSAPAPSRDFMSKGLMAYEKPSPSTGGSNGRMPLIVGAVAALVLVGVGAGVFLMHRSSAPVPVAKIAAVASSSPAEHLAVNSANEPVQSSQESPVQAAGQPQTAMQTVAVEQPQPVAAVAPIPAVVTSSATPDARTEPQNAQRKGKNAVAAKQPDASSPRRPAIPNLMMSSPSAPHQKLADLAGVTAPIADIAATEPVGGSTPAGLLTSSGRTSSPPAALPFAPAPVAAPKTMRDPKLISSSRVAYPSAAKQANVQGSVTISASIDANGTVVGAKALNGPFLLRQAAVDSVRQWKYSPAQSDGKSVPSQVTVTLDFRLN